MKKIKWLSKKYDFLSFGSIYKVIDFYKKQPIIIDNTGIKSRLNKKKDYQVIKNITSTLKPRTNA